MKVYKKLYPLWISIKFILHSTKSRYTKVITLTTIIGITLGIATLLTVLSIMNGFSSVAKTRLINLIPHISVNLQEDYDSVNTDDETIKLKDYETSHKLQAIVRIIENKLGDNKIEAIYPSYSNNAFIINNQKLLPIYINALPTKIIEKKLTELNNNKPLNITYAIKAKPADNLVGSQEDADGYTDEDEDDDDEEPVQPKQYIKGIILSTTILDKLDNKNNTSFANTDNLFKFYNSDIVGTFYAADPILSNVVLMDIEYANELFPNVNINNLNITLVNPNNAPTYAADLTSEMTLAINNWTQFIGNYFNVLEYTKQIMFILLSCILIVAMFNAVATLTTTLNEKQAEIAIIKTLGGNNILLSKVFILYGFIITTTGLLAGLTAGVVLSKNITMLANFLETILGYKFVNPQIYFIDYLPAEILSADVFNIIIFIYVIMILSLIYPIRKAYKISPIQALRDA